MFARALFVASPEPHDVPPQNKHVLGVTSLWMLVPVYHGLSHGPAPLAALLACVCAVSTVFWSNPVWGSPMHMADKVFSWMFTAAMVWYSADLEVSVLVPLMASILVFFLLSDVFFRRDLPVLQLLAHLLFRFCFYVWCHVLMVDCWRCLELMTAGYVGHAALVYFFVDYKYYWASCAALATVLITLGSL